MPRVFENVGGLVPRRSVFDLSHDRKFDCDMGELIPILVEDVIPGDVFDISNEVVLRFHQSLFAPLLHEVNLYVHYFFVPYRILWDKDKLWPGHKASSGTTYAGSFEQFLSGDEQGTVTYSLPRIALSYYSGGSRAIDFLYGIDPTGLGLVDGVQAPSILPMIAYMRIWNEYYRNQTFQSEIFNPSLVVNPLRRNWERDYFTSALPWQQRGTAPALPVSGMATAVWANDVAAVDVWPAVDASGSQLAMQSNNTNYAPWDSNTKSALERLTVSIPKANLNANTVNLSSVPTFDISQLRLAIQTQKWLERNARAGVRYTELLRSHFNVAPRDDRLDRPEYIGGSKQPVIFSEVLQTSETADTPQGHLAGHGISVNRQRITRYRVQEFGCIMGIMSVMPRTAYQQGINRMWLRDSKYEFYWPEFAHLSEQPVWSQEIYLASTSEGHNRDVFGYQGRYDEYRYRGSSVHGSLRNSLDYWHLGRKFSSRPALNSSFLQCEPRKDIYPAPSLPGMLINFGNIIRAARPMPLIADPGMLDHF